MRQPIKFYVDEHIATAVVKGLRQRGADVLTVLEAGLCGASDAEHLARAQTDGCVLFTKNRLWMPRPAGRGSLLIDLSEFPAPPLLSWPHHFVQRFHSRYRFPPQDSQRIFDIVL